MDILIEQGWDRQYASAVANLYEDAFGQKFRLAIPNKEQRIRVFADSFFPEFSFIAKSNGKIMGVVGFHGINGSHTGGITVARLMRELGWFKGAWACLVFALFDRKPKDGELIVDSVAVEGVCRGQGVGSRLLDAIMEYAHEEGYESISLDVIDTNPRAQKLYESKGYKVVKQERFPYLKWLVGFSASTTLALPLNNNQKAGC